MSYKIEDIEGIGPAYGEKLRAADITSTDHFLKLCCDAKGRKGIAAKTEISEKHLLKWANLADLMRLKGVGPQFSELLEGAGVDTVKELRHRNAENLATKMSEVNEEKKLTRRVPDMNEIQGWIEEAKTTEPTITH